MLNIFYLRNRNVKTYKTNSYLTGRCLDSELGHLLYFLPKVNTHDWTVKSALFFYVLAVISAQPYLRATAIWTVDVIGVDWMGGWIFCVCLFYWHRLSELKEIIQNESSVCFTQITYPAGV